MASKQEASQSAYGALPWNSSAVRVQKHRLSQDLG